MKISFIIIIYLLYFVSNAFSLKPELEALNGWEIDLGIIKPQTLNIKFPIKNITNKTIIIKDIESSCGCTVTQMEDNLIEENDIEILNIKIYYKSVIDKKDVVVRILTDSNSYNISIKAVVYRDIKSKPISLPMYSNVVPGDSVNKYFWLHNIGNRNILIENVSIFANDTFSKIKISNEILYSNDSVKVEFSLVTKTFGTKKCQIEIETNSKWVPILKKSFYITTVSKELLKN